MFSDDWYDRGSVTGDDSTDSSELPPFESYVPPAYEAPAKVVAPPLPLPPPVVASGGAVVVQRATPVVLVPNTPVLSPARVAVDMVPHNALLSGESGSDDDDLGGAAHEPKRRKRGRPAHGDGAKQKVFCNDRIFHFTYKGHLTRQHLGQLLQCFPQPEKAVSLVWEMGDEQVPYEHTHILLIFGKAVKKYDSRFADLTIDGEVVHPNIKCSSQKGKDVNWAGHIWYKYHTKSPFNDAQKLLDADFKCMPYRAGTPPDQFIAFEDSIRICQESDSSMDAAIKHGFRLRSYTELVLLRRELGTKQQKFKPSDGVDVSRFRVFPEIHDGWDRKKYVLWLSGPPRIGKSEYAASLFRNPLIVTSLDDLRNLSRNSFSTSAYDGVVFNDCDDVFETKLSACAVKNLFDVRITVNRSLHNRFTNIIVPPGVAMVITSNNTLASVFHKLARPDFAAVDARCFQYTVPPGTLMYQ